MRLNVFSEYTYTLETIIQAGQARMAVTSVPVQVNDKLRESRLMKSMFSYIRKSLSTTLRIFVTYRPVKFFMTLGGVLFTLGGALCLRWLVLFFMGTDRAHVPSLVLAAILLLSGFVCVSMGVLGELSAVNRKLLEDVRQRVMRLELDGVKSRETTDEKP
jgi:hypothetical protein